MNKPAMPDRVPLSTKRAHTYKLVAQAMLKAPLHAVLICDRRRTAQQLAVGFKHDISISGSLVVTANRSLATVDNFDVCRNLQG